MSAISSVNTTELPEDLRELLTEPPLATGSAVLRVEASVFRDTVFFAILDGASVASPAFSAAVDETGGFETKLLDLSVMAIAAGVLPEAGLPCVCANALSSIVPAAGEGIRRSAIRGIEGGSAGRATTWLSISEISRWLTAGSMSPTLISL